MVDKEEKVEIGSKRDEGRKRWSIWRVFEKEMRKGY